MSSKRFVLDTSLFVNPAAAHVFGSSPTSAFTRFLELAQDVREAKFYMPPSIFEELMHFAEQPKIPPKLLLAVEQKAPKKNELRVPGIFLYQLVDDTRDRVDRGLRLAERHVREALAAPKQEPVDKNPKAVRADAEMIGRLRETYRRIMREGALDSAADVDLLLLAYELEATLVSADLGAVEWAKNLGLTIMMPETFAAFVQEHAQKKS